MQGMDRLAKLHEKSHQHPIFQIFPLQSEPCRPRPIRGPLGLGALAGCGEENRLSAQEPSAICSKPRDRRSTKRSSLALAAAVYSIAIWRQTVPPQTSVILR